MADPMREALEKIAALCEASLEKDRYEHRGLDEHCRNIARSALSAGPPVEARDTIAESRVMLAVRVADSAFEDLREYQICDFCHYVDDDEAEFGVIHDDACPLAAYVALVSRSPEEPAPR